MPVVYFLGIAPGRYQAILPAFISGWDAKALKASVAFGAPMQGALQQAQGLHGAEGSLQAIIGSCPDSPLERRYALQAVQRRLHQSSFREAIITAYGGRLRAVGDT